jgi:hypothetical protein
MSTLRRLNESIGRSLVAAARFSTTTTMMMMMSDALNDDDCELVESMSGVHGEYTNEAIAQGIANQHQDDCEETTDKLCINDFLLLQNIGSGSFSEVISLFHCFFMLLFSNLK